MINLTKFILKGVVCYGYCNDRGYITYQYFDFGYV